jgi:hypothetical protein
MGNNDLITTYAHHRNDVLIGDAPKHTWSESYTRIGFAQLNTNQAASQARKLFVRRKVICYIQKRALACVYTYVHIAIASSGIDFGINMSSGAGETSS